MSRPTSQTVATIMNERGKKQASARPIAALISIVLTACSMDTNREPTDDDIAAPALSLFGYDICGGHILAQARSWLRGNPQGSLRVVLAVTA